MPTLPGGAEWVIILLIVLLLFGGRKLPGLARSMGASVTEFRRAARDIDEVVHGTEAGTLATQGDAD